jgi:acyl carrier protein
MNDVLDRDQILERLKYLVSQHIGIDATKLQPSATIGETGIDSFKFIELIFLAEEEFEISMNLEHVHVKTVSDVLSLIQEYLSRKQGVA